MYLIFKLYHKLFLELLLNNNIINIKSGEYYDYNE